MAKTPKTARKAASAETEMDKAGKRQERLKRIAEANKITVTLETDVRKLLSAEAKDAGMNVAPYLQKLIEDHVMANASKDDAIAERVRAKRALLDQAVELARKTDDEGAFDEHFILKVMKRAAADQTFQSLYAVATASGDKDSKQAARARVPLNQQLGRLIKRAAGARSKRDGSGKIMRAQVQGEIITTYTLLEKAPEKAAA